MSRRARRRRITDRVSSHDSANRFAENVIRALYAVVERPRNDAHERNSAAAGVLWRFVAICDTGMYRRATEYHEASRVMIANRRFPIANRKECPSLEPDH